MLLIREANVSGAARPTASIRRGALSHEALIPSGVSPVACNPPCRLAAFPHQRNLDAFRSTERPSRGMITTAPSKNKTPLRDTDWC